MLMQLIQNLHERMKLMEVKNPYKNTATKVLELQNEYEKILESHKEWLADFRNDLNEQREKTNQAIAKMKGVSDEQ